YSDYKKGNASTNNLSEESISSVIQKAENISKNTQPDECQGLPSENYTKNESKDLEIYYPMDFKIENAIDLTNECESEAFKTDKRISNSEGSSFSYSTNQHILLNTKGAFGSFNSTDYSLSCIVLAKEKKLMERDYWYSSVRDFKKLESVKKIGNIAAKRAVSRLGAKNISTRVCPVIFSPEMSVSLISNFLSAINGEAIYKKSSFLLGKLNEQIFPEFINIKEEPHLSNGPGTRPYDSEGVLTFKKDIIKDGLLKTYLLDTYSARKLKSKSTGNGVLTNIIIDSSDKLESNIISTLDDGIYITEMMGSGANTLTGDYSRGAFGYLIKNGKIQYPVTGITVASNLVQMFKNIVSLGDDVDMRNRITSGSMMINDVTIGGSS
ncbi:MAG: metalloprotease PmbA, partial [Pelagibacterales bacterium]|nr:metalloprotease PmbA [Pelagibacterales bacterium]